MNILTETVLKNPGIQFWVPLGALSRNLVNNAVSAGIEFKYVHPGHYLRLRIEMQEIVDPRTFPIDPLTVRPVIGGYRFVLYLGT